MPEQPQCAPCTRVELRLMPALRAPSSDVGCTACTALPNRSTSALQVLQADVYDQFAAADELRGLAGTRAASGIALLAVLQARAASLP